MPKSSTLSLALQKSTTNAREGARSPASPQSLGSSPLSSPHGYDNIENSFADAYDPHSPITSLPQAPHSPGSPKAAHAKSRSIFSNLKASRSQTRLNAESSIRQVPESGSIKSSASPVYQYGRGTGSTPELRLRSENASSASVVTGSASQAEIFPSRDPPSNPQPSNHANSGGGREKKSSNKHRFPQILTRSRSIKEGERGSRSKPSTPKISTPRQDAPELPTASPAKLTRNRSETIGPTRMAPTKEDLMLKNPMPLNEVRSGSKERRSSKDRDRSVDRQNGVMSNSRASSQDRSINNHMHSMSLKENSGGNFFSTIRTSGTRATDDLGKASKRFFGKLTRSGSSHERDQPHVEENYVCKVINLPLITQTRLTRISKRLEDSKDKTEFWMPALPWRCIDYLNMNGCDQEGLYRVPGSVKELKHWQRKFDEAHDVDLFNEEDLYDINIIGSMFKAWLRDLPDEIFPKDAQRRVQDIYKDEQQPPATAPQELKDELSKLPPYNYYLLFAITCHISLLHSCQNENKMNYKNICICFQPCMKMDSWIFNYLVLDWRNCWQGCWTEKEWMKEEEKYRQAKAEAEKAEKNENHVSHEQGDVWITESMDGHRQVHKTQGKEAAQEYMREVAGKDTHRARPTTSKNTKTATQGLNPKSEERKRPDDDNGSPKPKEKKDRTHKVGRRPVPGQKSSHEGQDRTISSSESSKPSMTRSSTPDKAARPQHIQVSGRNTPRDESNGGLAKPLQVRPQGSNDDAAAPHLSPMKPVSPISPLL